MTSFASCKSGYPFCGSFLCLFVCLFMFVYLYPKVGNSILSSPHCQGRRRWFTAASSTVYLTNFTLRAIPSGRPTGCDTIALTLASRRVSTHSLTHSLTRSFIHFYPAPILYNDFALARSCFCCCCLCNDSLSTYPLFARLRSASEIKAAWIILVCCNRLTWSRPEAER